MCYFFKCILLLLYFMHLSMCIMCSRTCYFQPLRSLKDYCSTECMELILLFPHCVFLHKHRTECNHLAATPSLSFSWDPRWAFGWVRQWTQNSSRDGRVWMGNKSTCHLNLQVTKLWQTHRREVIVALFFIPSYFKDYQDSEVGRERLII